MQLCLQDHSIALMIGIGWKMFLERLMLSKTLDFDIEL